jgi:DNA-directed RNA polymerase I, II, and III subunit RPABC2
MKILEDFNDIRHNYDPSKNVSRPVLTKYELTKIIGMRIEQLARGAPSLVEIETNKQNIRNIVMKELQERLVPFMIIRSLPNGQKEYWRLTDMIIPGVTKIV